MTSFWNPYKAGNDYRKTWDEAFSYIDKKVSVIKECGTEVIGIVRSTPVCANGGVGLVINLGWNDTWIGPEFKSITEVK